MKKTTTAKKIAAKRNTLSINRKKQTTKENSSWQKKVAAKQPREIPTGTFLSNNAEDDAKQFSV